MINDEENLIKVVEHDVDTSAHEIVPFYMGAEFWVFAGFVIVVFLIYKKIKLGFLSAMKLYAEKIRDRLSETRRIRDETQAELVLCQKRLRDIQDEISAMVAKANDDAIIFKRNAKRDFLNSLKVREEKLNDRIEMDKIELKNRIKKLLVSTSIEAINELLKTNDVDDSVLIHNTIVEFSEILKNEQNA